MAEPWSAAIIIMGVSGAGKSTVGTLLAERLGRVFVEGDSLHPPHNVEKMKHGVPLTDADRIPWLKAIAARIDTARQAHKPIVVTCSALKRDYRELLVAGHDDVGFVYLKGTKELIARRVAARTDHFMPPELLDSQFSDLQEPAPDEPALAVPIDPPPDKIVDSIVAMFTADRPA
ncbi:MAG TPA: gluconokinase [Pseudolabrys sp.]|jgi:gluconokinase|nr:gluconokinase [Pseudolabrys sp.]